MPELIEVEAYRRLATRTIGRTVASVPAVDELGLRSGLDASALRTALTGVTITGTGRRGKLLLLETDGPVVGLRFGMTGRLLVDDDAAIDRLEYSSDRDDPAWDRLVVEFTGGGSLRTRDPRRLGGVELDPDVGVLGVDAASVTPEDLAGALGRSRAPLKARLLDQRRIAGLGNLLVDETLWRAGLAPGRAARSLADAEVVALAGHIVATVAELSDRGGSHTGDLHDARAPGSVCPLDGEALRRSTVGGRTTYHCPRHQR